jgi:hypothetical protein
MACEPCAGRNRAVHFHFRPFWRSLRQEDVTNKIRRWAGTLLTRQHELPDKRGMVPRHLLLICCPDDIGDSQEASMDANSGEPWSEMDINDLTNRPRPDDSRDRELPVQERG